MSHAHTPTEIRDLHAMAVHRLAAAFDKSLMSERLETYLEGLSDIPAPVVKTVCDIAALECKFFPSLAELRERCGHGPDPSPPVNTSQAEAQWADAHTAALPPPFDAWTPAHWRAYLRQWVFGQRAAPGEPVIAVADHVAYRALIGMPPQVTPGPLAEALTIPDAVPAALAAFRARHPVSA